MYMLSLDFNKRHNKESNNIAFFITIIVILSLTAAIIFPGINKNTKDSKQPATHPVLPTAKKDSVD